MIMRKFLSYVSFASLVGLVSSAMAAVPQGIADMTDDADLVWLDVSALTVVMVGFWILLAICIKIFNRKRG